MANGIASLSNEKDDVVLTANLPEEYKDSAVFNIPRNIYNLEAIEKEYELAEAGYNKAYNEDSPDLIDRAIYFKQVKTALDKIKEETDLSTGLLASPFASYAPPIEPTKYVDDKPTEKNPLFSGMDIAKQYYSSAAEGVGEILDLPEVLRRDPEKTEEYKKRLAEQEQFRTRFTVGEDPALEGLFGVESDEEVGGLERTGRLASATLTGIGEMAPQLAATGVAAKVGAGIGATIGTAILPGPGTVLGGYIGATGGAMLAQIPFFYGINREAQKEEIEKGTIVEMNEGAALLLALPAAAFDTFADALTFGLGGNFTTLYIKDKILKDGGLLTKRVVAAGVGTGAGALVEVPTEIGQLYLEKLASVNGDLEKLDKIVESDEFKAELFETGVAAGAIGGTIRGAGDGVFYESRVASAERAKAIREQLREDIKKDKNLEKKLGEGRLPKYIPGREGILAETREILSGDRKIRSDESVLPGVAGSISDLIFDTPYTRILKKKAKDLQKLRKEKPLEEILKDQPVNTEQEKALKKVESELKKGESIEQEEGLGTVISDTSAKVDLLTEEQKKLLAKARTKAEELSGTAIDETITDTIIDPDTVETATFPEFKPKATREQLLEDIKKGYQRSEDERGAITPEVKKRLAKERSLDKVLTILGYKTPEKETRAAPPVTTVLEETKIKVDSGVARQLNLPQKALKSAGIFNESLTRAEFKEKINTLIDNQNLTDKQKDNRKTKLKNVIDSDRFIESVEVEDPSAKVPSATGKKVSSIAPPSVYSPFTATVNRIFKSESREDSASPVLEKGKDTDVPVTKLRTMSPEETADLAAAETDLREINPEGKKYDTVTPKTDLRDTEIARKLVNTKRKRVPEGETEQQKKERLDENTARRYMGLFNRLDDAITAASVDVYLETYTSPKDRDVFAEQEPTVGKGTGRENAEAFLNWADRNLKGEKTKAFLKEAQDRAKKSVENIEKNIKSREELDTLDQQGTAIGLEKVVTEESKKSAKKEREKKKISDARSDAKKIESVRKQKRKEIDYVVELYNVHHRGFGTVYPPVFHSGSLGTDPSDREVVIDLSSDLPAGALTDLKNNNLAAALNKISTTSKSKFVQRIAKRFADNLGSVKVQIRPNVVTPTGLAAPGYYDPQTNTIVLDDSIGFNTHTILHEVSHALQSAQIADPNNPFTKQLQKLYDKVKDKLSTSYGSKNLDEFLAEFNSNPKFRIDVAAADTSIFTEIIKTITNFFNRLLGRNIDKVDIEQAGVKIFNKLDKITIGITAPQFENRDAPLLYYEEEISQSVDRQRKDLKNRKKDNNKSVKDYVKDVFNYVGDVTVDTSRSVEDTIKDNNFASLLSLKNSLALGELAKASGFGDIGLKLHRMFLKQRQELIQNAEEMRSLLNRYRKLKRGQEEILDDLIYNEEYGTTIHQVNMNLTDAEAKKKYGKQGSDQQGYSTKYDHWVAAKKVYDTLLPETKYLYKAMQKYYKKLYKELEDTVYQRAYEAQKVNEVGISKEEKAKREEAAKAIKDNLYKEIFTKSELEVYFPLVRDGKFKLISIAKEGVAKSPRDQIIIERFTNIRDAERAQKAYEKTGDFESVEIEDDDILSSRSFDRAPPTAFVSQVISKLRDAGVDAEVSSKIIDAFVKSLPETSFVKRLQSRTGVAGYISSSKTALQTRGLQLGKNINQLKYQEGFNKELEEMNQLLLGKKDKVTGETLIEKIPNEYIPIKDRVKTRSKPLQVFGAIIGPRQYLPKAIYNETKRRVDFASGKSDGILQNLASVFNQFAFLYTLGFNPSSTIVNLSQIPLFVLPYFGGEYGYLKTEKAIYEAINIVRLSKVADLDTINIRSLFDRNEDGTFRINKNLSPHAVKILKDADIETFLEVASSHSQLDNNYILDQMGLQAIGTSKTKQFNTGGIRTFLDAITSVGAYAFQTVEKFNRQVVLLSAYRLELDKITKGKTPTKEQKIKAATNALYITQKVNSGATLETGAGIAQSAVGRVGLMYKNYGLQMVETMFDVFHTALPEAINQTTLGKIKGKEGREVRKAARKQALGLLVSSVLFAGIRGIPIYGALAVLYNTLVADDEDDDFDDVVVDLFKNDALVRGPISYFTGADVSERVRLSGLLLQENRFNYNSSLADQALFYLGGPFVSSVKKIATGIKKVNEEGFTSRNAELLLPTGMANILKAQRFEEEGIQTRKGATIGGIERGTLTSNEILAQYLGFPPRIYNRQMEENDRRKRKDVAIAARVSRLKNRLNTAFRKGSEADYKKAKAAIDKFNSEYPNAPITVAEIIRSRKAQDRLIKEAEKQGGINISRRGLTLEQTKQLFD
jgi:hypothetical protein